MTNADADRGLAANKLGVCRSLRYANSPDAPKQLLELSFDPDVRVQELAILYLGGLQALGALASIATRLKNDSSFRVRAVCAVALGLYEGDANITNALLAALSDPSDRVAGNAVAAIAKSAAVDMVEKLKPLLKRKSLSIRLHACELLIGLGFADHDVLNCLNEIRACHEYLDYESDFEKIAGVLDAWIAENTTKAVVSRNPISVDRLLERARIAQGDEGERN